MPQTISIVASQAFSFLPAIFYNLGLLTLSGWVLWFRFGGLLGHVGRRLTILLIAGLLGLIFVGFLSLGLAMAGWFSAASFYGAWAVILAALAWDGWRRGRWKAHLAQWRAAQPLPVWFWLLALLWLLLYGRPFEMLIGGRDPGVYVNTAAQIAEQGSIVVTDPFFADLPAAVQRPLVWCYPNCPPGLIPHKFPGFFWIGGPNGALGGNPGVVLPQFFHLYSALMAPSYAVLGYPGSLTVLPVIMLLFGLLLSDLLFSLLPKSHSEQRGLLIRWSTGLPVLLLWLNPTMYWFGRLANADVVYGFFCFAALFFWTRAAEDATRQPDHESQAALTWSLVLLSLGAAILTKIDSWYLLPGLVVTSMVYHPAPWSRRARGYWLVWALVCAFYLLEVMNFSYPYVLGTLRALGLDSSGERSHALWLSAGYLLVLTLIGLLPTWLEAAHLERLRLRLRLPVSWLSVVTVGLGLLGLFSLSRVWSSPVGVLHIWNTLSLYLPWTAILVAGAGMLLLIILVRDRALALSLLTIFFSSGLFIILRTAFTDYPWSERRATSIAIPSLVLFQAVALAELFRWSAMDRGHAATAAGGSTNPGNVTQASYPAAGSAVTVSSLIRSLIGGVVLVATLAPMFIYIPARFTHQEADGANAQLALLESLFPPNAVVLSDGAMIGTLFGPSLSRTGSREILTFQYSAETTLLQPATLEQVGDAALATGRPFFVVTESDNPPSGHFLWARRWWGEWDRQRMIGTNNPWSLTVDTNLIRYRIYQAIGTTDSTENVLPPPARSPVEMLKMVSVPITGLPSRVRLYEAEAMSSLTGRLVKDASAGNGWARVAEARTDVPGALVFGPYVELPAGNYTARFRLRSSGDSHAAPSTLLVMGEGGRRLAEQQYGVRDDGAAYSDLDMPFALERPEKVEFSVIFGGAGLIWLDRVEFFPAEEAR